MSVEDARPSCFQRSIREKGIEMEHRKEENEECQQHRHGGDGWTRWNLLEAVVQEQQHFGFLVGITSRLEAIQWLALTLII
jgi:hypothetical protein